MARITRVHIRNWRSIKDLTLDLGSMTVLVGANNAGKTNILSALSFLLGPRWPMPANLADRDFHGRDPTQPLNIQVWLEGSDVGTIWLHSDANDRGATGLFFKRRGSDERQYAKTWVRDECPLIYLGADRNYERQFGMTQWTLFGQAVEQMHRGFKALDDKPREEEVERLLTQAADLLKVGRYDQFTEAFKAAFASQVQASQYEVGVDFRTFSPLNFYKNLQPVLYEEAEAKDPVEAGAGMRNLMLLALFRATAAISRGTSVMVVEEPEIYLHPHAQRSLASMFREMSDQGTQVILSTHSASFVSPEQFDDIAIVERKDDGSGAVSTVVRRAQPANVVAGMASVAGRPPSEASLRERLRHLCGLPQAEAMFGRAVVLVEGASELALLHVLARHMDYPFDALGISVIDCEGKDNIETFHALFRALGFPVYVVVDNDRGEHAKAQAAFKADTAKTKARDRARSIDAANAKVSALLRLEGDCMPKAQVLDYAAVLEGNLEDAVRADLESVRPGLYDRLKGEAASLYGPRPGKPAVARYMGDKLADAAIMPRTLRAVILRVVDLVGALRKADRDELEMDRLF